MKRALFVIAALVVFGAVGVLYGQQPDWQKHIDWSIGNTGAADCPDQYAPYPRCLAQGNRSCLMRIAIQSAKDNDCANAMRLTLTTQCHNAGAQQQLGNAGQAAVCSYLRTK